MSLTDDLYRDIILEHFRNPRNQGTIENPTFTSEGANPFCGDELSLTVTLKEETLEDIRNHAQGCSISQASTSMMSEVVKGKSLQEVEALIQQFKAVMLEGASFDLGEDGEDLQALEGVKKYPVRIKCALLSWNTLLEGILAHRQGNNQSQHVEGEEGEQIELANVQQHKPENSEPPAAEEKRPDLSFITGKDETQATDSAEKPEDQVRDQLKQVIDPELNLNIVDLGLVYKIETQEAQIKVDYTLTSPGCPLGPVIKGQMETALKRLPWVKDVQTNLVWKPPWDPRTMASDEIKTELGIW